MAPSATSFPQGSPRDFNFRKLTIVSSQVMSPKGQNDIFFFMCSLSASFPPVSLNFAGGASMLLKPEEYLVRISSVVSLPLFAFETT